MKAIKLLAAILCLVLCGFFALAEDTVAEYTIVIDDTHPVCEEQLFTQKLCDFIQILSILQNGNAHICVYAASDTSTPVFEVEGAKFDVDGLWEVYDKADDVITPHSTQPRELPGKRIWISLPFDDDQVCRNILAEDQIFTRPAFSAEGVPETPAGSVMLNEKINTAIDTFRSTAEENKKIWSAAGAYVCDFDADVNVLACALEAAGDIGFQRYENGFTTGDGLGDPEKVKRYFVLSDMDFSEGAITALPLFNGLYYAYVSDMGVQIKSDRGIFAVKPVYKLYHLTESGQQRKYGWTERNVSFNYEISQTEEAGNTKFDSRQWRGYAIITSAGGDIMVLSAPIDEKGNAAFSYTFDEYGEYTVSFTAINREAGETLVSENTQLILENAAPQLIDDTKEYCTELVLSLLGENNEQTVDLSDFYADDRYESRELTYYVNGKKIDGSRYTASAENFEQSTELVVGVRDPEGIEGTQTKIKIDYIPIADGTIITAEEFVADGYFWEERKVPLNCSISGYGDIWNVKATIYDANGGVVCEETLAYVQDGTYVGECELVDYGAYTVEYSAVYQNHEEGPENIKREFAIVNTAPELMKAFMDYEASEVELDDGFRTIDLTDYYSDDRLSAKDLVYTIENKPSWAKLNGTELMLDLNDVNEGTELHITADDVFGEMNADGIIRITYVPAADTVVVIAGELAFEGTTVTMSGTLEKTDKGNELDCLIGNDWSVSAEISCGDEIVAENIALNPDGNGGYAGSWRIEESGAYSKDYSVILRAKYKTGSVLESEKQTVHVENKPPKVKNDRNELCVMRAAGLKLDSEDYSLNLADYFTDDKTGTITYQLKDEFGNRSDAIEHATISNGILTVDPAGINGPLTIYVVASDNEGADYSDAYVSIAYTAASDIAELKLDMETAYQWTDLPIRVDCEIISDSVYSNKQTEWELNATITRLNKFGGNTADPEPGNMFTIINNDVMNGYESLIDSDIIHNESGKFRIEVEAVNKFSGDSICGSTIVTINNMPPEFTDKLEDEENGVIKTFFVAPVEMETEPLVITDYYYDSKDGKKINCTPDKTSGFSTQGDTYFIDAAAIHDCSVIGVTAEDSDGSENTDGRIQIIYLDFAKYDMPASFDLTGKKIDEIHRNSTLNYSVNYAFETKTVTSDPELYEGYALEKSGLAKAAGESYARYLKTLTVSYEVTLGSKKVISERKFDLNETKEFSFCPDKDFDLGGEVVEPGKYTLKVWITAGRENVVLAEKQDIFEIINVIPVPAGQSTENSYECTIPLKESAENHREPAVIDLAKLVFAESRETIQVTPCVNRKVSDGWSMKLYRTQDGYLYTDTVHEDMDKVSCIKWRTDDKTSATKLTVDVTAHGKTAMSFDIRDDQNAGFTYDFTLHTWYKNEKAAIFAGMVLTGVLVLAIIVFIIIKTTKPAFRQDDVIKVKYNGMETEFSAESWKKDGITLREILIYSGLPVSGRIFMKDCDAAKFNPDKKNDFVVSFRKDGSIRFSMSGAEQKNGFKVPRGESVTVQLNDTDKFTVTKA